MHFSRYFHDKRVDHVTVQRASSETDYVRLRRSIIRLKPGGFSQFAQRYISMIVYISHVMLYRLNFCLLQIQFSTASNAAIT